MSSASNIKGVIDEYVNELLDKQIAKIRTKGNELMRKYRRAIIYEWFEQVSPSLPTMIAATEIIGALSAPESHVISRSKNLVSMEFVSYIDGGKYSPNTSSAEGWVARHGGGMEPKDWILSLQMDKGIVGLPQYANTYASNHKKPYNAKGWSDGVNEHFYSAPSGLEEFTDNHVLWESFGKELINSL